MGNTGWRRSKNDVVAITEAASRRVAAKPRRKQRRDDDDVVHEEEQTTRAWWRRRRPGGGALSRAGGGAGAAPGAGTAVTVKVVMRRKDAEALAARLSARARKARMAELKGELLAGRGGASPASSSCRNACWSPMLPPIKEN